jgi:hypothetical protein
MRLGDVAEDQPCESCATKTDTMKARKDKAGKRNRSAQAWGDGSFSGCNLVDLLVRGPYRIVLEV